MSVDGTEVDDRPPVAQLLGCQQTSAVEAWNRKWDLLNGPFGQGRVSAAPFPGKVDELSKISWVDPRSKVVQTSMVGSSHVTRYR